MANEPGAGISDPVLPTSRVRVAWVLDWLNVNGSWPRLEINFVMSTGHDHAPVTLSQNGQDKRPMFMAPVRVDAL